MQTTKRKLQRSAIHSLDEALCGGIPVGSTILLTGTAGTGKTLLSQQWLFAGYKELGEKGIYIAVTEPINKALENVQEFSFFDANAVSDLGVHYTDFRAILQSLKLDTEDRFIDNIDDVLKVLRNLIEGSGSKRVVIDSITSLFHHVQGAERVKTFVFDFMFKISQMAAELGTTVIFTSEISKSRLSAFGVEEFIADGIIELRRSSGEQSVVRSLQIVKMRGSKFIDSPMGYKLTDDGFVVFPKIPPSDELQDTNFVTRRKTGVDGLDAMLNGGVPEGHIVLVGGNTGSGKSTLCMRFVTEGIKEGETVVYVALEEPEMQIKKTALSHGWDFASWEEKEKLRFVSINLIDTYLDEALYEIVNAVETTGAKRIVIDSISALESATTNKEKVREFMLQLSHFLKGRGVTCLMSYLIAGTFGASKGQLLGATMTSEMRLSSNVDGVIMMRYVEQGRSVKKLINVLKLRGSDHDKAIREFHIAHGGIKVAGKFKK